MKEAASNLKSAKNEAKNLADQVNDAKKQLQFHRKQLDRLTAPTKGAVNGSIADTFKQMVDLKKEFNEYARGITRFDASKATKQKVAELQGRIDRFV